MNRSDGVGVSEVVCHPPSLGYVRRSSMEVGIGISLLILVVN
ncbi:hypothetical protein [Stieleria sp. JC731]|nr:hypothetical protein [Stieleria sp. JC731]